MRRALSALLLLAVSSLVAAPAPFRKSERLDRSSDVEKLQGEWHCHDFRAVVTGDRVRWYKGQTYVGIEETIYLIPTGHPKGIDITVIDPSHRNVRSMSVSGSLLSTYTPPLIFNGEPDALSGP